MLSRPPRGLWGPRVYRLCEGGLGVRPQEIFKILPALKCAPGTSEAPFAINAHSAYIPASCSLRLAVSDRKVRRTGPSSGFAEVT